MFPTELFHNRKFDHDRISLDRFARPNFTKAGCFVSVDESLIGCDRGRAARRPFIGRSLAPLWLRLEYNAIDLSRLDSVCAPSPTRPADAISDRCRDVELCSVRSCFVGDAGGGGG